ncbi:MAG TPA: glycosyltransferase family 39 protein [Solirubrobacteraceae bacterium]|nr:glycosyltransferase family 39 protein [Solirubrobacteraceae bacterium]
MFAGDRRVWQAAALMAVPFVLLTGYYMLVPRPFFTGTNSVEDYTYVEPSPAGARLCVPGLHLPAGTGRIRLIVVSRTTERPVLQTSVVLPHDILHETLPAEQVGPGRISTVEVSIPERPPNPAYVPAAVCATASGLVNWGGTPLLKPPHPYPPTLAGVPFSARVSVWFLPPAGMESSYLARAGAILSRASLFRPGLVGPWLYAVLFLLVLPALALLAIRTLAIAAGAGGRLPRRPALLLFAIAFVNFSCWALITPSFQAPDEVDHFAYTQSLVERGQAPSPSAASTLPRWSSSEYVALDDIGFFTDHQVGDSRPPWLRVVQREYERRVVIRRPPHNDGGGNETAATHGPIYYAALAPAYVAGGSSPFSELTLMRITSALIGALVPLFTFLLARELAPGRPWIAVLAALLVAFQPMYGFISGSVNNDVGVNAGAAALELLLIRVVRRGLTLRSGLLIGLLLALLPLVKGTVISLYPVAALALLAAVWRHRQRANLAGAGALVVAALIGRELGSRYSAAFSTAESRGGEKAVSAINAGNAALQHPLGYLSYVWQVFLPRLSFMSPHFEGTGWPAFVIFVERGWGAFGWYDVFFRPWVYDVILAVMLLFVPMGLIAARREWRFVRANAVELALLVLMPVAVIAGFEAAFYSEAIRNFVPEFGRYAFPAIAPVAVLVVASLHALGRRLAVYGGVALLVAMLALSLASQLLTLTTFYA